MEKSKLYPLLLEPLFLEKVWGGNGLERYGKTDQALENIGESWELSDNEVWISRIRNGPYAGMDLSKLCSRWPNEVYGHRRFDRFPILVKFISARKDLSIQVHPDDPTARELENAPNGKTEMWVILESDTGARVVAGLVKNIGEKTLAQKISDGTITGVLNYEAVEKGNVFLVEAGQVHAIMAGTTLLEIQQNSDITYRIYDYNRPGLDGRPRELHVEKALKAVNLKNARIPKYSLKPGVLVANKYFVTSYNDIRGKGKIGSKAERSFTVAICIGGQGNFEHGPEIEPGDTFLLPACIGEGKIEGHVELITVSLE